MVWVLYVCETNLIQQIYEGDIITKLTSQVQKLTYN